MKGISRNGSISQFEGKEELQLLRHSAAHVLAQAVKRLYPGAKFAFGPATETGFYYDIDFGESTLTSGDLPNIEAEMQRITEENLPVKPFLLSKEDAVRLLKDRDEPYKLEHLAELPEEEPISFFRQGEYMDMCRGPHITHTKALKAFCLTDVSGAYWKNDNRNKMLTRIRGTAFPTAKELSEHLHRLDEAQKQDHRNIGKEMELFLFRDEAPGFPFFLPNGLLLKNALIEYWREIHTREQYQEISTPMIMDQKLWEISGHWAHYRDIMYSTEIDDSLYCIKPMNCPGGILVYKSKPRSYRDLPIRMGELGTIHRNELSGTLHGLFRVRCLTQDDAHIFMRRDQIMDEIIGVANLIDEVYRRFGFRYSVELSTRPESSMGSDEDWALATAGLRSALDALRLPYTVNEGDGAFYGPKIDFHLEDSLGRTWQCGTIQLDFQLPQNFRLEYTDENGEKQRPIMLHRVCFGSIERFLGILTEHYAGKFPLWLAPLQVKILSISEKSAEYAAEVAKLLQAENIRCRADTRSEKIGYKIREAQNLDRVPYMLIVGQTEKESGTVSLRPRDSVHTEAFTMPELLAKLRSEISSRS